MRNTLRSAFDNSSIMVYAYIKQKTGFVVF